MVYGVVGPGQTGRRDVIVGQEDSSGLGLRVKHRADMQISRVNCVTMEGKELDSGITFDPASWPGVDKQDDERSRSQAPSVVPAATTRREQRGTEIVAAGTVAS